MTSRRTAKDLSHVPKVNDATLLRLIAFCVRYGISISKALSPGFRSMLRVITAFQGSLANPS